MSTCTSVSDAITRDFQDILTIGLASLEQQPGAIASAWNANAQPIMLAALNSQMNKGGTSYELIQDFSQNNRMRVKYIQHLNDGFDKDEIEENCELNAPGGLCESGDDLKFGHADIDFCKQVRLKISVKDSNLHFYQNRNAVMTDTAASILAEIIQQRMLPAFMSKLEKTLQYVVWNGYVGPFADGSATKTISPLRTSADTGGLVVSPADIQAIKDEMLKLQFNAANPIHLFGASDMSRAYIATQIGTGNIGGQMINQVFGGAGIEYHYTNTLGSADVSSDPKTYLAIQNGAILPLWYNFFRPGSTYRKEDRTDGLIRTTQVFNTPWGPFEFDLGHYYDSCNYRHTFTLQTQFGIFGALASTCVQNPLNPQPNKTGVLEFVNS
jgi:hypothetical protein